MEYFFKIYYKTENNKNYLLEVHDSDFSIEEKPFILKSKLNMDIITHLKEAEKIAIKTVWLDNQLRSDLGSYRIIEEGDRFNLIPIKKLNDNIRTELHELLRPQRIEQMKKGERTPKLILFCNYEETELRNVACCANQVAEAIKFLYNQVDRLMIVDMDELYVEKIK